MAQNLKGILPDKAIQVITQLQSSITSLSTNFSSLVAKGVLTPKQAETSYGSAAQRKELQVSGKTPLNVAGLPGLLGQAQVALANSNSAVPANAQPGSIVTINNVINQVTGPGTATPLSAIGVTLFGTYATWTLTNFDPASFAPGTLFAITDWNVVYEVQVVSGSNKWVYRLGTYIAAAASRPTTGFNGAALGANDAGLTFLSSDTFLFSFRSASAWVGVLPAMLGDSNGSTFPTITLVATAVTPATYGDGTHVPQFTVDTKGRLTFAQNVAISGAAPTGAAGGDLNGSYPNPGVGQVNGGAIPVSAGALATDGSGKIIDAGGFTGTLAAAITAGKNVVDGLIQP